MEQPENKPEEESLRVQLSELNNRSRWYGAQLWHIPFAYFGIVIVALVQIAVNKNSYLPYILISIGFFGCFVLWHMFGLMDGVKRAVTELQNIEKQLHLRQTAQYRQDYTIPLFIALIILVLASISLGFYLLNCGS